MKTKHARLIRSAIEKAREDTQRLDDLYYWVEARLAQPKYVERYENAARVWDKRFNIDLWSRAYKNTADRRMFLLSGSTLYHLGHRSYIENQYRERYVKHLGIQHQTTKGSEDP